VAEEEYKNLLDQPFQSPLGYLIEKMGITKEDIKEWLSRPKAKEFYPGQNKYRNFIGSLVAESIPTEFTPRDISKNALTYAGPKATDGARQKGNSLPFTTRNKGLRLAMRL